jgi:signal peptidase I
VTLTAGDPVEDDPVPDSDVPRRRRSRPVVVAIEWLLVLLAALGTAVFVRTYIGQTFWIPTASMAPTLAVDDRVVIDKLSYRLREPRRGEIVVFRAPARADLAGTDLIKRIVALPGERISVRSGRVVVDGKVLPERYLPAGRHSFDFLPYRVPEGSYFVMGDNRSVSNDSRIFGPVRRRDIVGRAMIRIWPFSRLAKF